MSAKLTNDPLSLLAVTLREKAPPANSLNTFLYS
jgi:hypothetical protein